MGKNLIRFRKTLCEKNFTDSEGSSWAAAEKAAEPSLEQENSS